MPRTFSRGQRWTFDSILEVSQYVSLDDGDLLLNFYRNRICIDSGLIEQDVFEFFFDLRDKLSEIRSFQEVPNIPGIIPRINTILDDEIVLKAKLNRELNRVRRPDIFV